MSEDMRWGILKAAAVGMMCTIYGLIALSAVLELVLLPLSSGEFPRDAKSPWLLAGAITGYILMRVKNRG